MEVRPTKESLGGKLRTWKSARILAVVAMLASTLIVIATGSVQVASAASKSTIAIGSDLEQSGAGSSYGEPEVQGAQFYLTQIDKKGGVDGHKIVLDSQDNQSTTTGGVSAFDKLAETKDVVAVFGPAFPDTAALMASLAQHDHLTLLSFLLSATDQAFNSNPYWFRMAWSDEATVDALLAEAKANGDTTLGVLYPNDAGGTAGWAVLSADAANYGITISGNATYQDGVVDPTSEVLSVSATKPSAYVVWDPDSDSQLGLVVKTIRANGVSAPIYVPEDASLTQFVQAAGSTISNVYYWASFSPEHPLTTLQKNFANAWQAKYGSAPTDFDSAGYAQAQIIVEAITKVLAAKKPVTRVNVKNALQGLKSFTTVYGPVSYSSSNHAEPFKAVTVLEYRNGQAYQVTKP